MYCMCSSVSVYCVWVHLLALDGLNTGCVCVCVFWGGGVVGARLKES